MAKKFDAVTQQGLKAQELATRHRAVLEARLGAGAIDGLGSNLTLLGASVAGQVAAREQMKSSTVSQAKALENAALLVTAIRGTVKAHGADKATAKAYGVGTLMNARVPKSVAAAATGVLTAWSKSADTGRSLGILDTDIAALTTAAAAARAADEEQDHKRVDAPLATKARNEASKAVEVAVKRIAAAGALQFATDAKIRGSFESLVAGGSSKKKPAPAT